MGSVSQPNAIAEGYLMFLVGRRLGVIISTLESPEWIGIERVDPSDSFSDCELSPSLAIKQIRELSNDVAITELLAKEVDSDLSRNVRCLLIELREEICQADVPAEIAMVDGYHDEAVAICRGAVESCRDQCKTRLRTVSAQCELMADSWSGMPTKAFVEALGCEPKKLSTNDYLHLEEVLETRRKRLGGREYTCCNDDAERRAAAKICEQVKELATEHRAIDEVAAMPVVKAVDAILGYMDRVQELRAKWTDVEAAGRLRGYQWDHPFRTASTATRSALEQAQANCYRICKWLDENTKTDPDAPLGQSMQKAIDRGDDMAPFVAASIEAIKRRVPAACVTRIDEERRYILECATRDSAIASDESQTVEVPARNRIEDSFATLATSIDKLTDSIPDKLSGVVPAKPKKALSLDELELPQVREMIEIADLHLQWLEAGQPKDGELEAWLPEHGYQDGAEAFLKCVYDRDRKYKSDYKMALPTKGRPKREKALANQKRWVNRLKSIESDLLA